MTITVGEDGNVMVKAPMAASDSAIKAFLDEKEEWIIRSVESVRRKHEKLDMVEKLSEDEVRELFEGAAEYFPERCRYFARLMDVSYGRITIRNQKTRWGSCSAKGNLNFNAGLMLAPPEVRDYVVVHELAHRRQMNHSPAFWKEVERVLPDYRARRKWLRQNGAVIMRQIGW